MDKEEILAKSRKENKGGDEREKKLMNFAFTLAAIVGLVVCVTVYVINLILLHELNYGILVVFDAIYFTYTFILAVKVKKKGYKIASVCMCVAFICALIALILNYITVLA